MSMRLSGVSDILEGNLRSETVYVHPSAISRRADLHAMLTAAGSTTNQLLGLARSNHLQPIDIRSNHLRHHYPNVRQSISRHHQYLLYCCYNHEYFALYVYYDYGRIIIASRRHQLLLHCFIAFYVYYENRQRFIISSRMH